ncbi:MAG: hypothetical protein M1608_15750, partial [Candidatus Omnitrophica bacterium]|nr:hypothetical protein [Candidatus Omnitrophota bacterium]
MHSLIRIFISCGLLIHLFGGGLATAAPPAETQGGGASTWTEPWKDSVAQDLQAEQRAGEAAQVRRGEVPPHWAVVKAGDLGLAICQVANGIRLESLFDTRRAQELLATNSPPMFNLLLRHAGSTQEVQIASETGWDNTRISRTPTGLELTWSEPVSSELTGISVTATGLLDGEHNAVAWKFRVNNENPDWGG